MNLPLEIGGVGIGAVTVAAIVDAVPPEAQGWTVLGLLAVVVVGIGGWLIKNVEKSGDKTAAAIEKSNERVVEAIDKNTTAQAATATALALLTHESETSRTEGNDKRRQILERLDQLPAKVAEVVRK